MQEEMKSGIYCIENVINNKKYIGQSVNIKDRWRRHKSELENNTHDNDYLQKAWNKYGKDSFNFYILEYCYVDKLDEKEAHYIDLYNTMNRDLGYNLKSGGQFSNYVCDEIKNKISKAEKKAYENPELRKTRSIHALIQWANPEIKEKIMGENNGMYGKHHTEEARRKMSEKKKGKPSNKRNMTPVLCIELNKTFDCAVTAAKELSLKSTAGILEVCKGNRKTAGGYHWKFLLENNIC